MLELNKLSLGVIILLAVCAANIHASSFSEIELLETHETDEIDFSFCFNEHYNDINISYLEANHITACFFNGSQQLYKLYCHSKAPYLLNDLISGLEYSLSWLHRLEHYQQANLLNIGEQKQKIKQILALTSSDLSSVCLEHQL